MFSERTPAHWEDVPGVILAPVIKSPPPPVEHDEHLVTPHFSDSGRADQVGILLIYRLQLHAWLEIIQGGSGRFLKKQNQMIVRASDGNQCWIQIKKLCKANLFKG